ncbi:NAD-binding protein [Thermoactinomyces sp. CICC 24226]|jgi:3-hydroxybutyryl-CoA dehydrogenase|nr:3-hydroxybutyryl-CoA dehydrogenase [Thermoactinomyces sp. Gus2-1]KYQ87909.1 3-hydroxybutyryl-CoA dehydrogenase [Thermoactinomyces sp. AS95]MBH8582379.1 NAD-binding protein [Thermoactinomyces sp. CICC 10735]MBH8584825.1 NAD-binding protein [Thermoactinomyces sp. CICC 10520]MBI0386361.1 NAD-binding protein [Thermoactinomyces sp. CICC 24227]MBI0391145.1 NAD-binding protein [Thermoactinomyces sp. CICC 24226]QCV55572.1 3-hydroxybutyryl-CoA dehydrogenase [Thermoactinomyces vulgaris]
MKGVLIVASIQNIAVIGGGTMGRGIAELIASKGFDTTIIEQNDELAKEAYDSIEMSLDKKLSKWGITLAEKKMTLSRLHVTSDMNVLKEADFVIESVYEDMKTKIQVFEQCDKLCRPEVVLASNTSTLSLTEIAAATNRPQNVIGLHFVHPVPRTPLVEMVRGLKTSQETVETVMGLLPKLEIKGVEVYESPGFVTTRLIVLLINEAIYTLMEGVASEKDIDRAMKIGYHFDKGPLEMADHFGLDSILAALERLYREFGDIKYRPAPLLKKMVRAGHLGVKTGEGFFRYDEDGERIDKEEQQ